MPEWSKEIRAAIAPLNLDPMREAEMVEELGQHLNDRYEEMLISGTDDEQARQSLLTELQDGSLLSGLKTTLRAPAPSAVAGVGGKEPILASIGSDLRYGARLLRKNSGFAIVAILSLALGIGANTAIFQMLDAVRLRTLPVKAPDRLALVDFVNSPNCCSGNHYAPSGVLTSRLWNSVRVQQKAFSEIAAWAPQRYNLGQGGEAQYADALMISGDFFNVLGLQPLLGRLISPADDYRGCGAQGAVLSYSFWQRTFGGRATALGNKVTLNGHPFQIIGVAPPTFYGMQVGQKFDVAIAMCSDPVFSTKGGLADNPVAFWIAAVGRLKPGWTIERASAQLNAVSPGIFAATLPETYDAVTKKDYLSFHLGVQPAGSGFSPLRGQYEDPLWLLLALSGLVLLIACANLANLMLARTSVRGREMALRLTLGASRSRLIRQLLAESLLLAALGTITGAILAQLLSTVLVAFLSTQQNPIFIDLKPDWRVLGFAAGLAVVTCILFGLTPAIQASRTDPGMVLKAGGRGATAGRERFLLRRALVVSQVALSLVLVTGAFLFVRTLRNLTTLNPGFQQEHILIARFDFSPLHLPQPAQMAYKQRLVEHMQAIPDVRLAAETLIVPMSNTGWDDNIAFPGGPQREDVSFNRVGPGYFRTMQTPFLTGRDFAQTDTPTSPQVAIVNEAFVRKYAGGKNPLGMTFNDIEIKRTYQVIGLVKDTKQYDLREEPVPIAFVSFTQADGPEETSTLMIRSEEPLQPLIASIKRAAADLNPAMVLDFSVFKTQINEGLLRERLMATLSGFFGLLATILAMVGLYGVISYMVIRRRNEIGVRMALGADRSNILFMVMREAAMLVGIGLALGAGLALAAATTASSMLYGLKATDPLTLALAIGGMALVAMVASLLPAQRASKLQPMAALREE
jgi:putative ABC transport system permease protein